MRKFVYTLALLSSVAVYSQPGNAKIAETFKACVARLISRPPEIAPLSPNDLLTYTDFEFGSIKHHIGDRVLVTTSPVSRDAYEHSQIVFFHRDIISKHEMFEELINRQTGDEGLILGKLGDAVLLLKDDGEILELRSYDGIRVFAAISLIVLEKQSIKLPGRE